MSEPSPPGDRVGVYPLSSNQLLSWYQPILTPTAPAHYWHLPLGMRITGALDVAAFRSSLGALVQRHASTRTTFERSLFRRPRQRVHKSVPVVMAVEDLRALDPDVRQADLRRRLQELLKQPFDWEKTPPWRSALFQLEDQEHLFFAAIHHIIADAWSQAVLFRELSALYQAFSQGEPSPLR